MDIERRFKACSNIDTSNAINASCVVLPQAQLQLKRASIVQSDENKLKIHENAVAMLSM